MEQKKKIIAFDMDGTLVESRLDVISQEVKEMLNKLSKDGYIVTIISSGDIERLYEQIKDVDLHIIGEYGLQSADIVGGKLVNIKRNRLTTFDNDNYLDSKINEFRKKAGFIDFVGRSYIINESGFLIISLLGDEEDRFKRNNFDPDGVVRKKYLSDLKELFPNCTINIGGKTSYDIFSSDCSKYNALKKFCEKQGYNITNAIFFGDQLYNEYGNDYSIYANNVTCVNVDDYRNIVKIIKREVYNKNI